LRFGDEVRKPAIYFGDIGGAPEDAQLSKLADDLIKQKTAHWSSDFMKDPIQEHLLKLIETKKSPGPKRGGSPDRPRNNVVNIFQALKQSLQDEKRKNRR
jgi:DNA end-binding protein Ku